VHRKEQSEKRKNNNRGEGKRDEEGEAKKREAGDV